MAKTERDYGIVPAVFCKWEKIYFEEGIEGLTVKRRGSPKAERKPDNVAISSATFRERSKRRHPNSILINSIIFVFRYFGMIKGSM
jgi:hypothetical protein